MSANLKAYILQHVNPVAFYQRIFSDWKPGQNVQCPFHKKGKETNPSLSLSVEGEGFCFTCGWKATSILGFYTDYKKLDFADACRTVYHEWVHPIIPNETVEDMQAVLWSAKGKKLVRYLREYRGLKPDTIKKLKFGYHTETGKLAIPIYDEFNFWTNVRLYDWRRRDESAPKYVSWGKGYGTTRLWPLREVFDSRQVYLFEGELDAALAIQWQLPAVTTTGGAGNWKESYTALFRNKDVIICYDSDKAGREGADKVSQTLKPHAASVKVIDLPVLPPSKDFTDYVVEGGHKRSEFLQLVIKTDAHVLEKQVQPKKSRHELKLVSLKEASSSKYYLEEYLVDATVAGKDIQPFIIPKKAKVDCGGGLPECAACPRSSLGYTSTETLDATDPAMLKIIRANDDMRSHVYKSVAKIPFKKCNAKIEVLETVNIEQVMLIPVVGSLDAADAYVLRPSYYVGHGLESNRNYRMRMITVADPKDQHVAHLIIEAQPVGNDLDGFALTKGELYALTTHSAPTSEGS